MKKVLLVLLGIIVLAAAGLAVFLATFDLDKYRPMVTAAAQKALGRPVTLGKLKLGWDNGLAVQARQFAILESDTDNTPLVEVEQVNALVRLQPLLRKQIEVASVVIERPVIRASRDAQGTINLIGPAATVSPAAAPTAAADAQSSGGAPPMAFEIDSVRIEKGTLIWRDAMVSPPKEIALNQLDVAVKNIAPGRPMDFDVRGALAGDRQNLTVTGRITLPSGQTPLTVGELHAHMSDVPLAAFLPDGAVPVPVNSFTLQVPQVSPGQPVDVTLQAAVGSDQPNVKLTARVTMPEGQAPLSAADIRMQITDPPVQAFMPKGSAPVPLKSVDVSVAKFTPGQPLDVSLKAALAADQPNVEFSGRVTLPAPPGTGSVQQMKLVIRQLNLADVAPPPKTPKDPKVRGTLSVSLDGALPTLDPVQMMRQLSAKGRLQVSEPVIENLNVIREVLGKLSLIPGVGQRMHAKLPPEYQAKLEAKDTILLPVDTALTVDYGVLRAPDLVIRSDTFGLYGFGPVNLAGPIATPARIQLDPHFSAAIISSVNELQAMTTPAGELDLPLTLTGAAPYVMMDIQAIAAQLIQNKVGDFLGELINKNAPQQPPAAPGQPAPGGAAAPQPMQQGQPAQPQQPPSGEELLGQFLQRVLQPPPAEEPQPR